MLQFKFVDLLALNNFALQDFFHISYSLTGNCNFDIDFFNF